MKRHSNLVRSLLLAVVTAVLVSLLPASGSANPEKEPICFKLAVLNKDSDDKPFCFFPPGPL